MRSVFAAFCLAWVMVSSLVSSAGAQAEPLSPSVAESTRVEAREAFRRGVNAARAGRWDEARAEFAHSHELVPSAVTMLNLAGSQINTGNLVEGYENYRRILRAPADAASHRALVERVVVDLESRIPSVRIVLVRPSSQDELLLDGVLLAQAGNDLLLDPGPHRVELKRPGRPAVERNFELREGQDMVLDLDEVCALCEAGRLALEPRGTTVLDPHAKVNVAVPQHDAFAKLGDAAEEPPRPRRRRYLASYLAYGVGAAGLVLFSVTGPLALARDHALSSGCGRNPHCSASEVAAADRLALAADVGLGVAIGGVLVGTIALVAQRRGERRVSLAPTASRQGAGVSARMWF